MDQKTDKLYPSAPLSQNIDLKKRLEKKLIDVNILITTSVTSKR